MNLVFQDYLNEGKCVIKICAKQLRFSEAFMATLTYIEKINLHFSLQQVFIFYI